MTDKPGRRARKKAETRDALIASAYALFRAHGFGATTMDEVAEHAGVSRRTAFRYFPTKEALVFPHRAERLARFTELLAPHEGERPFDAVRRACLAFARDYEQQRDQLLAQYEILMSEPALRGRELELDREYEDVLAQTLGRGRSTRRARVWAGAILGAIQSVLREWLEAGAEGDLVRLGREAFTMLEAGADE